MESSYAKIPIMRVNGMLKDSENALAFCLACASNNYKPSLYTVIVIQLPKEAATAQLLEGPQKASADHRNAFYGYHTLYSLPILSSDCTSHWSEVLLDGNLTVFASAFIFHLSTLQLSITSVHLDIGIVLSLRTLTLMNVLLLILFHTTLFCTISHEWKSYGLVARSAQTINGVATLDGIPFSKIPSKLSTAEVTSAGINRSTWSAFCDSFQPGNECANAIDGKPDTFWHTAFDPIDAPLPHCITINMKQSYLVGNVTIEPRQDGNSNGHIGQHTIALRYFMLNLFYIHLIHDVVAKMVWNGPPQSLWERTLTISASKQQFLPLPTPDMCESQPFLRQATAALGHPLPKCIYTVGMLSPQIEPTQDCGA